MVAIKGIEMPNACTSTKETLGDIEVANCPLYNVCKHRDTIRTNYKPSDCPLVEIEEIRIGKWIDCGFVDKSFREYKCSSCGESVYEKEYQIKYHKYCLNCGSRNEVK